MTCICCLTWTEFKARHVGHLGYDNFATLTRSEFRSFSITLSFSSRLPVGNPRPGICQCRLSWKGRVRAKAAGLVLGPPFLPHKPGKKSERERERKRKSTFQQVELPTPPPPPPHPPTHTHTHTHTTRFFCKGEPWKRLTKGSCKSPSWPPSMSTALGVKGRTNYIHSQQTPLLYNTSCPSLATAERTDRNREREREREREVEFFLFH